MGLRTWSMIEGYGYCVDGCSYDCCSDGGLQAELPDSTLGYSTGWGSK